MNSRPSQQDKIKSIALKLKMLGMEVLNQNSFGIIYRTQSNEIILIILDKDGKQIQLRDIEIVKMSRYFIITGDMVDRFPNHLFVADGTDVCVNGCAAAIIDDDVLWNDADKYKLEDIPVIVVTSYTSTFIINNVGNKLDVTSMITDHFFLSLEENSDNTFSLKETILVSNGTESVYTRVIVDRDLNILSKPTYK